MSVEAEAEVESPLGVFCFSILGNFVSNWEKKDLRSRIVKFLVVEVEEGELFYCHLSKGGVSERLRLL
jgi:hypothetical protein